MIHSTAVLSFAGSVFRAVALGLFGLYVLASLPPAALNSGARVLQAVARAGEDSAGARRRLHGDAYVEAVERLRRTLPRDGEYLLVNGTPEWLGSALWVRYDLAPRRARYLGVLSDIVRQRGLSDRLPAGPRPPRWVIIAFPDRRPPLLIEREAFLRQVELGRGPG